MTDIAVAIALITIATLCILNSPGGGCGYGADWVAVLISVCGQNVSQILPSPGNQLPLHGGVWEPPAG